MSKINAIRIINLNYNNNSMKVDDETFRFNGESTLLSLRNGGGKSVLVQIMMAPFMNPGARNMKHRPFSSYFTSSIPTYILVEWQLDGPANFVLTGMMVRKRLYSSDEDTKDDLETISFIHEYRGSSRYGIENIPLVETEGGKKTVKSYGHSKQLFENLKKDRSVDFNYYDTASPYQRSSYFAKLREYGINSREWESIIKKLNLKESGLSEMFTDCRNAAGLVEKWFIRTVEDKLNREEDKVKNFREIVMSYSKQYRENKTKIEKRKAIEEFFVEGGRIKQKAEELKGRREGVSSMKNSIANLAAHLRSKKEELEETERMLAGKLAEVAGAIEEVQYEKLSMEIYTSMDRSDKLEEALGELAGEIESGALEKADLEQKRNIMECAKIFGEYKDFSKDVQKLENELEVLKRKNQDLGPERENLGYTLMLHYSSQLEKLRSISKAIEESILELEDRIILSEKNLRELNSKLNRTSADLGAVKENIKSFDKEEERFNREFGENFSRNITGLYDSGMFAAAGIEYGRRLDVAARKTAELKSFIHEKEEENKTRARDEKDAIVRRSKAETALGQVEEKLRKYEEQLDELRGMLRYIEFGEDRLFDREGIIGEFDRKLDIADAEVLRLSLELRKETEELKKLKSGTLSELSQEMEAEFLKRDIHIVHGMKWLRNNSHTQSENEKLVTNNPFIPYSLIMNADDIRRLESDNVESFTNYPVPIIRREELESCVTTDGGSLISLGKVKFLISFNSRLMDEDELAKLTESMEKGIAALEARIGEFRTEAALYRDKKNRVVYSIVEEKEYQTAKLLRDALAEEAEEAGRLLRELMAGLANTAVKLEEAHQELKASENSEVTLARAVAALGELKEKYEEYCTSRDMKEQFNLELEKLLRSIRDEEAGMKKLAADRETGLDRRRKFEKLEEKASEHLSRYVSYREGELVDKDIEDIEARFESLNKTITEDEKNLEERLATANRRFKEKQDELEGKETEYGIEERQFREEVYDSFKERQLRQEIKILEKNASELEKKYGRLDKEKALADQTTANQKLEMKRKYQRDNPKARDEIKEIDFDARIKVKEYEKKDFEKAQADAVRKTGTVVSNLDSLSEFSEFVIADEIDIKVELEEMTRYRGELARDYRESLERAAESKARLDKEIERVLRREVFRGDDFFRKPLEKLEELSGDPEYLLENLEITVSSYKSLVEKLNADIELIVREKENVLQSLFDYVFEVHENIGKIDRNSTINIRGRSVKMLKITTPKWQDNKTLYRLKLSDMLDRLTENVLDRLDKNENAEEAISTAVTTKNLYNEVVSIGSVEIKLYKIEEEKEYPISWDEVAKNSGGEGFLSAFVILSSLLSYMRRDDTDVFAEKESSKVLLMDNPFAQTSSEHLLKPLMEIARKSNTQLICLSGLGGDSIYNRFDNIYVLNLVSSKLKGGLQFLKGEHLKGEDETELIDSANFRITEEIEQMDLF